MDPKKLTFNLLVAYRVLRESFPRGVAPESDAELADFREAMRAATQEPSSFSDLELASIIISVGFHFLGRVFPLKMHAPVMDAVRRARQAAVDPEDSALLDLARVDASDVCLKLFFFRSIFPKSAIVYPETILARHSNELAPFGICSVEPLDKLIAPLGFFRFKSPDGRYFANMEAPEDELVTTTLRLAALDLMRRSQQAPAAPVPFDKLLHRVYIPPEIARRALNAQDAPFQRRLGDCYVPVDDHGAPLTPVEDTPNEPRSVEPGPNDGYFKTFTPASQPIQECVEDALSNIVYPMLEKLTCAPAEPNAGQNRFYPDRRQALDVPHDHALLTEIESLPLRFKRVAADADEESSSAQVARATAAETPENQNATGEYEEGKRRFEAHEKLGELVDALFADKHSILYYRQLYDRHEALFQDAGIDDAASVKSALQAIRPQYEYDVSYMQPFASGLTESELVRNQLVMRWGDSKRTTLANILENVYVPRRRVTLVLEYYVKVFNYNGDDAVVDLCNSVVKRASEKEAVKSLVASLPRRKNVLVYYDALYRRSSGALTQHGIASPAALRDAILKYCGDGVQDCGDYMLFKGAAASRDQLVLWTLRSRALEAIVKEIDIDNKGLGIIRNALLYRKFPAFNLAFFNNQFLGPSQDVVRVLNEQQGFFKRDRAFPGSWFALNLKGMPLTIDDFDEIEDELCRQDSRLNQLLLGAPSKEKEENVEPLDADQPSEDGDATARESENAPAQDEAAREAVGALVDRLFADNYVVLFYSKLWERHEDVFRAAGVTSDQGVRAAILAVRPQYDAKENYVQSGADAFGVFYEAARRQFELRWGDKKITTLAKLAKDLYIPQRMIQQALKLDSTFKPIGRDGYSFEDFHKLRQPATESAEASATTESTESTEPTEAPAAQERETRDGAPLGDSSLFGFLPDESESSESAEEDAALPGVPRDDETSSEPATRDEKSPKLGEPSAAATRTLAPEERLAALVSERIEAKQTIVYYRALLEGDKALAKEYGEEAALRDAIRAKFPAFGYYETFFEPRRRAASESEHVKIRRALLLGWGDVERFKLEKLEKKFYVPATLLERVLKACPDDFRPEGKQRFSITERARREGATLREYAERVLTDLKTALSEDDSFLFYSVYFERNRDWLEELGLDSFELLRREMANLSKEHALGHVFYKTFCAHETNSLRYHERVRRALHANWGDSPIARVDQLYSRLYAPKDDIIAVLHASPDFTFMGVNTFRRVRDVDGAALE
ncbi:MAG: hypothetical protein IJL92_07500 [Thermoguttaceae bacterium]|nr:hypothetical protein [Thermoguttaceae bacterium]